MIFVSVNTPTKTKGVGAHKAADLSFWEGAARMIASVSKSSKIVVEKSTVPVKTAEAIGKVRSPASYSTTWARFRTLGVLVYSAFELRTLHLMAINCVLLSLNCMLPPCSGIVNGLPHRNFECRFFAATAKIPTSRSRSSPTPNSLRVSSHRHLCLCSQYTMTHFATLAPQQLTTDSLCRGNRYRGLDGT